MELENTGKSITGKYATVAGEASGEYTLVGRTDTNMPTYKNQSRNIGFVVSWGNESGSCDSVTTWSGKHQIIDGEEILQQPGDLQKKHNQI